MKVLIVDDSRSMRMILKKMMGQMGFSDIAEAEHGAAALESLESSVPELALVDWNMPVMGGQEFIEKLREKRDYDRLKVMVVTSESSPRIVYEALKAAGILIRYMNYAGWGDGLRVTVGTDDEIDAFLAVMKTL